MLFDAKVNIKLPGNTPEEAIKRLKDKIHYEFSVESIQACDVQPPPVVGEGNIIMPTIDAKGY